MNAEALVKTFMIALEAKDYDTADNYLTDDFLFSGWTLQPLGKKQFITVMSGLKEGIPNLTFNSHTIHDKRDPQDSLQESYVKMTTHITGTQTNGFILTPLGTPPIPQMGKAISMPEEEWNYTLANEKIARIVVGHVSGGGIQGLLHQLDIALPIEQ